MRGFSSTTAPRPRFARLGLSAMALFCATLAASAEPYPFEGTWVRADRICSPAAPSLRSYTAKELTSAAGHCVLRKVVFGSGEWELFEDCRRSDHPGNSIEKIRMMGPDQMVVKHQVNRLKIPRGRRFTRCMPTAPRPSAVPVPGVKPTTQVGPGVRP